MRAEEAEDARLFLAETGISTDSVVFGRFFDISLCSGEEEIQPEGRSVTVEILLPEGVDVQVVHFTREPEDASPSRPMLTASADGLRSVASAVAEDEPSDGADTGDVVRDVEVEGTRSCSRPPDSPPMPSSRVPRFFLWAGPGFPPWRR